MPNFLNYEASERRRNIIPFGLLPSDANLSWIADTEQIPTYAVLTYAPSIAINTATAQTQIVTLTGHLDITSILKNGGAPDNPTILALEFIQDSTGGWQVFWPSTVALNPAWQVGLAPNQRTVVNLLWAGSRWECWTPPNFA